MIVRVTFKSSNALYNSCRIRQNGWKEARSMCLQNLSLTFLFLDIFLDLHCFPIVSY